MDINQYPPIRLRKERKRIKKESFTRIVPNTTEENTIVSDDVHKDAINKYYNSGDDNIAISTYEKGFELLDDMLKNNLVILKFPSEVFVRLFDSIYSPIFGSLENQPDEDIGCMSIIIDRVSNLTMDYAEHVDYLNGEIETYTASFRFTISNIGMDKENKPKVMNSVVAYVPLHCVDRYDGKSNYVFLLNKETMGIIIIDAIVWENNLALFKSFKRGKVFEIPTMEMKLTI